jgi:hypothetical protein
MTWLLLAALAASCTTTREARRPTSEAELARLNEVWPPGEVRVGVARQTEGVVLRYAVSPHDALDLKLTERQVTFTDLETRQPSVLPIEALSWISWLSPSRPRLTGLLQGAGLGLLSGAPLGVLAGFLVAYAPDSCVGGSPSAEVGGFAVRCFPTWPPALAIGAAVVGVVGAIAGGVIGALRGHQERLELIDGQAPGPTCADCVR